MVDRDSSRRLGLAVLAVIVLVVEGQSLLFSLGQQSRRRDQALAQSLQGFLAVRTRLETAMRPGGPGAWHDAAAVALEAGLAQEVDFLDVPSRRPLLSLPSSAPTTHWPAPDALAVLRPSGPPLVVGPLLQPAPRILVYASFVSGGEVALVRFSASAEAMAQDLRDRRPLLVGHGLAVGLLVLMLGLCLLPGRRAAPGATSAGPYEAAMEKLRDQGRAREEAHEAEKRRMEELVRDKEAMARAGELTAGIVHEVRNGLGTIVGYARLIEQEAPAASAESARQILAECETLEAVVRRFMDFVKDETLNLAPVDLARLVRRVVARETRGAGGEVRVQLPDELPPLAGDEEMLERVFENVVRNAREAAGPEGRVALWVDPIEGGSVTVHVTDDGAGLPEGFRIGPFRTTKPGGLGLGLPMAVKVAALHGGELRLQPRRPRGVDAVIRLPLAGPE